MAGVRPIFQPVLQGHQHATKLIELASEDWLTELTLSAAFANAAGVRAVSAKIALIADRCRAFIGVRNGSTTAQALSALLKLGVEVYAVDTSMRARIFHPKFYLAVGNDQGRVVIGSANLTHAGLFNNLEAGADISLDLQDANDHAFIARFREGLDRLINDFPDHCFRISSGRQIIRLLREGVIEDERRETTGTSLGAGEPGATTTKKRIDLPFVPPPKTQGTRKARPPKSADGARFSTLPQYGQLVWVKPRLPRTDLQLLKRGHDPGVLRLVQARFEVNGERINWRTYFRQDIFGHLAWGSGPNDPEKEMAVAPFSLVVAGVYVGDFDLTLSHKPAWEAGQSNYTTGLHWGAATKHICHEALIDRALRLYVSVSSVGRFVIEID
jgi:hypothetical protein